MERSVVSPPGLPDLPAVAAPQGPAGPGAGSTVTSPPRRAVHHYGAAVSTWDLTLGLALAGLGLGTVIAPLANVVLADVREQDAGSASGVLNTGFQLGNSIGLALMGVIFIDQLAIRPGASVPRVFAAATEHAVVPGRRLRAGLPAHARAAGPTRSQPADRIRLRVRHQIRGESS
jgi:MFS family permease